MIGQLIHTYRIDRLLGEGGMGKVFQATDTVLERPVALKMLQAALLTQPTFLDRFKSEAQILARLNHPNVAGLYNFVREEGDYFMVMEFVEGDTLENWLERYGPLPPSLAVPIIRQATDGLNHAHKRGILHRDLKPANLMITPDGVVKLTDFGIARIMGSQHLTQVNGLVGTPCYMAPEQILGKEPSPQSDIHALGVVLYELLSGQVPFVGDSHYQTMERVTTLVPPTLPDLPDALNKVLLKSLHKDPTQRYETVRAFEQALAQIVPGHTLLDEEAVLQYQQPPIASVPFFIVSADDSVSRPAPVIESEPIAPLVISRSDNPQANSDSVHLTQVEQPVVPPTPTHLAIAGVTLIDANQASQTAPDSPKSVPARTAVPISPKSDKKQAQPTVRPIWQQPAPLAATAVVIGLFCTVWLVMRPATGGLGDKQVRLTKLPEANIHAKLQQSTTVVTAEKPNPASASSQLTSSNSGPEPSQVTTSPTNTAHPGRQKPPTAQVSNPTQNEVEAPEITAASLPAKPTMSEEVASPKPPVSAPAAPVTTVASRPEPSRTAPTTAEPENAVNTGSSRRLKSGSEILVSLQEPLAAANAVKGQRVSLKVAKSVLVNGEVLIPAGAEVQGDVTGVDIGGKKEMLELRVRSVQTPNGQSVPVRGATFKYVGSKGEAVQFKSGQQFVVYTAQNQTF